MENIYFVRSEKNHVVTKEFNRTTHEFPSEQCLPDLLWEQVRVQPDATAVVHGEVTLTYRELAARSSNLAAYLCHLGVATEDGVGIYVEPSIELMVGIWGILFSGGAYVPLSPEYPKERVRYMIDDCRARVIFTQAKLRKRLVELVPRGTMIVTLEDADKFANSCARAITGARGCDLRPESLAYIIYTSGSTGKPKGVLIEHRSIVNQMHWLKTVYQLNRNKSILQKTPMSFDAAQWEILAPCCGSKVVMSSPGAYRDPELLIETIIRHQVTTLQCVPTLLQALLSADDMQKCTSLTQIFSGGEALSKTLALSCIAALPGCELVNLYGPTECAINSSAYTVDRDAVKDGPNTVSIGGPVHNTQYYILDNTRSPVGVGEVGELYIGGVQLARGYLHRPDLTADRFVDNPFSVDHRYAKLYKTGDLAYWNTDGTVQFVGRTDNQVKLRGFRVELDEIRAAIEAHDWVSIAAVIVKSDPRTGFQSLIAFIKLNPKEATLMDQGNHSAHHQSKESKLQLKTQLSNPGFRDTADISGKVVVDLPGMTPTPEQWRRVFARKTYRFYEGGDVSRADILRLLGRQVTGTVSRSLDAVQFAEWGEILRYFGQYLSDERLLPKYGYASPGALYATQLYFEVNEVGGLRPGYYYYHPGRHQLVLIRGKVGTATPHVKVHFIGKKRAIEPVYKNNIKEVLEIETGHMVGLFEEILPGYGLDIRDLEYAPLVKDSLECADEDYYLGTFAVVPYAGPRPDDSLEIYVQAHPGKVADLPTGQYRYRDGELHEISDELILQKHVIAINQGVYKRASFGITLVSRARVDWRDYIDLGRILQHLMMNDLNLGFMSSGYSSKTGHDLPSARRMESILKACGKDAGPSYFFVGGRVSDEQLRSEGMKEDAVHMKGPAEMIREDLIDFLPDYMVPNRVIVLDELPLLANGKIDLTGLRALDKVNVGLVDRSIVSARTKTEEKIADIWRQELKLDVVSVREDFFELGGNSLIAVKLINKINKRFRCTLPLQVLFESPTIEALAVKVDGDTVEPSSRLVRLQGEGSGRPIYCWPGLGGYTMNLKPLAGRLGIEQPFYGVQAFGINQGEVPFSTIKQMAAADVELIQRLQPVGPYTLWGYSFGARVAFEAAYQLEQSGEQVDNLFLIAPGSPKLEVDDESPYGGEPTFGNATYVTILFSVFASSITSPLLNECLRIATDEDRFTSFISETFGLDADLVRRIVRVVHQTYQFKHAFRELAGRWIDAPVTIFKAHGDDYSFIENNSGYSAQTPTIVDLEANHYSMLKESGIDELVGMIRRRRANQNSRLDRSTAEVYSIIPRQRISGESVEQGGPALEQGGPALTHVNIKHFPMSLSDEQQLELIASITKAVQSAFGCDKGAISITLEPVGKEIWSERAYVPKILNRKDLLRKTPKY